MAAKATAATQTGFQLQSKPRHPAASALIRIAKNPVGGASGLIIIALVFTAIIGPWIVPYGPLETSLDRFESPSLRHPLGTDEIGRDQLTRIIYGSRISLYVGLISVLTGTLTGATVGLVSGFFGGTLDLVIQRFVDSLLAFPGIVLAMVLVSLLGTNTTNAVLAISIVVAPSTSRVVRSAVLSVKEHTFMEAARGLGASNMRLMVRHVLPNVVAPILILISTLLGAAILIEAGLSFLGLATQAPDASWGLMLATSGRQYMEIAPWLAIAPGLAISITVLAFNMFGDVVRDVLDPRLRGSR